MADTRILVVGAGFSGAVAARELAKALGRDVLVIEEREHIAGNCHTERERGIMVHRYGPHIFHTGNKKVWDYIQRYGKFGTYIHKVKAVTARGLFSLPVNLTTINKFFGKQFSPEQAREFVAGLGDKTIGEPQNFEEAALKLMGRDLYEAFFYGYTKKQWGCEPRELPASLLSRLPFRFDSDDSYFDDMYQGIPLEGYTAIVERLLSHDRVEVKLGTPWNPAMVGEFEHVVFTGPIDRFYDYRFGRLGYRTVFWENAWKTGDFQSMAVVNCPAPTVAHVRIVEHKHFTPWEKHAETLVSTEFSKETSAADLPFYPKRLAADKALLGRYVERAERETKVSFLGRLGTYRYLDMHQVIGEALDFAPLLAGAIREEKRRPVFAPRAESREK